MIALSCSPSSGRDWHDWRQLLTWINNNIYTCCWHTKINSTKRAPLECQLLFQSTRAGLSINKVGPDLCPFFSPLVSVYQLAETISTLTISIRTHSDKVESESGRRWLLSARMDGWIYWLMTWSGMPAAASISSPHKRWPQGGGKLINF